MCPGKDLGDYLVEEVLTDLATNYLGERKEIEDQVKLFGDYVTDLARQAKTVTKRIGMLNYLLLKKEYREDFFNTIAVNTKELPAVAGEVYADVMPDVLPHAITMKTKYIRWVTTVYDGLQKAVSAYMEGETDYQAFSEEKNSRKLKTNYSMVIHMAQLINEKITRANLKRSPASVLQFARSLDLGKAEKERVTGAMSSDYEERLDRKLVLKTINIENLPLRTFPKMPQTQTVRKKIAAFCKHRFKSDKKDISRMLGRIEQVASSVD